MDNRTGSWEAVYATSLKDYTSGLIQSVSSWAGDHSTWVYGAGVTLVSCGMILGIRHIVSAWNTYWIRGQYNRMIRNPVSRFFGPFRRLHSRWSARNLRVQMAKWKKELVADIFYEGLTKACDDHLISKYHKRRLMKELAVFFDIKDLKRGSKHPDAIKNKILANVKLMKETSVTSTIPGPKPGEEAIPLYNGIGSRWLKRKQAA